MYLTITFTQMLSAFTPSVTLLLLYLTGTDSPTPRATAAVLFISLGCALSSYGEGHFDMVGVAFRCVGIFTEALRLVLTQRLLKHHKLNVLESQYHLAPIGASCLLLGASVAELPRAVSEGALDLVVSNPLPFAASALLGVAASFMTFLVIKVTNSVTLKVLNTARNAAFVLFTVTFLHEEASTLQLVGYSMSLLSFAVYTYVKVNGL
uniref:Sugar phosphate transporter domain-containing protein n=2 Tax=Chrysotila carterae TaxID=13221 RepID=A0A7S4F811_CHRCT